MPATIKAISYVLPQQSLTNTMLMEQYPDWPIEKIYNKTGIKQRHIAHSDEYSVDLAIQAGRQLLNQHSLSEKNLDFIIFCSQTPKYLIPTNACILQEALRLPTHAGAIDVNQGCSGYVYALMLAESLINNQRAKNVLLITADTYTKLINPNERGLKTIFGDAASASLITTAEEHDNVITHFEYGSDGRGADKLIAKNFGMQGMSSGEIYQPDLFMDGCSIFNFTLSTIPSVIDTLLDKAHLQLRDIDLFVFHQANGYLLEHLRSKIGIPSEKFFMHLEDIGNTVSSSIPIALCAAKQQQKIHRGSKVLLVGFGVGLSWAATIVEY